MFSKYDEIRARRARGDKGFTLIELLVVVVIIGILIAIAIPVYLNYQNSAKKKAVESDVRATISSVEQCIADHAGVWNADCADDTKLNVKKSDSTLSITVTAPTPADGYKIVGLSTGLTPQYTVTYTQTSGKVIGS